MNDELRETLTLLNVVLEGLGSRMVPDLINQFLNDENGISNEELNEGIENYIKEYLDKDVQEGTRVARFGNLYIPLHAIKKWQMDEKYSYVDNCVKYRIIFNATEGTPSTFNNVIAVYDTEEERNKDIEKLVELKLSWSQV